VKNRAAVSSLIARSCLEINLLRSVVELRNLAMHVHTDISNSNSNARNENRCDLTQVS